MSTPDYHYNTLESIFLPHVRRTIGRRSELESVHADTEGKLYEHVFVEFFFRANRTQVHFNKLCFTPGTSGETVDGNNEIIKHHRTRIENKLKLFYDVRRRVLFSPESRRRWFVL